MEIINAYCGLVLIKYNGNYACLDRYTAKTKCKGTLEKCTAYFDNYMNTLASRD